MNVTKRERLRCTETARELVAQMTLAEKIALMSGPTTLQQILERKQQGYHWNFAPYPAGGNKRLGIPPLLFCDGGRGVACGRGKATCFPVPMMRGASFDVSLEEKIGRAIAQEARAFGANFFGGVCLNLPYFPGWGRAQEVYGEDGFAVGAMGSAIVRGLQSAGVIACLKHYAFNSVESTRFQVSVDCSLRAEQEVFLPQFRDCIEAGAAAVMTAYNRYQGVLCGHSQHLLREVLKKEWDFDGFAICDFFWGIQDTVEAVQAGLDVEMCHTLQYGPKLEKAVAEGLVPEQRIEEAALRITRTMLAFARSSAQPAAGKPSEHAALALQSAREGITLIKNEGAVLPLSRKIRRLAVIGKLAGRKNIGDRGSSRVYPPYVVTLLEGIVRQAGGMQVSYYDGSDCEHMKQMAAQADAVVFVMGLDFRDEGEYTAAAQTPQYTDAGGTDRLHLGLHPADAQALREVGPVNRRSVAVLMGGSTITVSEWEKSISSILLAYYPGQEGGTALGEILFGKICPSGKLPFVIPRQETDLPQIDKTAYHLHYSPYYGYRLLDREGIRPYRPYGFGMSYTTFRLENAEFHTDGKKLTAAVTVENTGSRSGTEVVQLYVGFPHSAVERPVRMLCGFRRVPLGPGKAKAVTLSCPVRRLQYYREADHRFVLEKMEYQVFVGTSSAPEDLLAGSIRL